MEEALLIRRKGLYYVYDGLQPHHSSLLTMKHKKSKKESKKDLEQRTKRWLNGKRRINMGIKVHKKHKREVWLLKSSRSQKKNIGTEETERKTAERKDCYHLESIEN